MTDQTPTPAEVLDDGWTSFIAGDGYRSIRAKTGEEHLAALAAAGFRVERVPDDQGVAEAERLIAQLRAECMVDPCDDGCHFVRAADLLERAFLSSQGETDG